MGTRRLIVGLLAGAVIAGGCGEEAATDGETKAAMDARQAERRDKVERAVDAGQLPPVALQLFRPDGSISISFIDGPNGDEDVVRSEDGGRSGPKLEWDLDGDGKITADEREITERELYDATLGLP
jgi:hypothetical protein